MNTKQFRDLQRGDKVQNSHGDTFTVISSPVKGILSGHLSISIKGKDGCTEWSEGLPDDRIVLAD